MPNLEQNQGLENNEIINSTLREGSKGSEVKTLQKKLIEQNLLPDYYINRKGEQVSSIDGNFGSGTEKAVKALQEKLINEGLLKPYYINNKGQKVSNIDGIFGKGTNRALISLENKEIERVQKTYEFEVSENKLKEEKKHIIEKYKKSNPEEKTEIKNIAERQENERIEIEQSKNREEFNKKIDSKIGRYKLIQEFNFKYKNDNGIGLNGEEFGDDTGKTFSFEADTKLNIAGLEYKVNSEFSHYTSGEEKVYYLDGNRDWEGTDTSKSTRIDYVHVDVQKKVYEKSGENYSVKGYVGVGIDTIGDYGGGDIQKTWHEKMGYYEHKGKYEEVEGFSPTINGTLELEKTLAGDSELGIYAKGKIEGQYSIVSDYGKTDISGEAGIGVNYGRGKIEVSYKEGNRQLPGKSETMKNTGLDGAYSQTTISGAVALPGTDNSSFGFDYTKGNKQDYFGLKYMYKF